MKKNSEVVFDKYTFFGPGYHWAEYNNNPLKMGCFLKARYEKCKELLLGKINKFENKKILDIGCGDGVLTHLLAQERAICYGIDLDKDAINFAIEKFKSLGLVADFSVQSCYSTNFDDNSFDAVISSDVIEHLQKPLFFLSEIKRILKPGGWGIISTPIRITEVPADKNHITEWFPKEFELMINNIFPISEFRKSHAMFWYEIYSKSLKFQIPVNLLSFIHNPFLNETGWKYFCLQYAVINKPIQ